MKVINVLCLLMLLLVAVDTATASTVYQLASVDGTDKITATGVTDTRFMSANNNVITQLTLSGSSDADTISVNISTPDYLVVYTQQKSTTGLFKLTYTETLGLYRNGILTQTSTGAYDGYGIGGNPYSLTLSDAGVFGTNGTLYANILPSPEGTVTASAATKAKITVMSVNELSKLDMKGDLNLFFYMIYGLATITPMYKDADSSLLALVFFMSAVMDFTVAVIQISITNTYLVLVWMEVLFIFFAGWRNNSIKGFIDDLLSWHKATAELIVKSAQALFQMFHDVVKAIAPGYG